jgi:hypothetical protein
LAQAFALYQRQLARVAKRTLPQTPGEGAALRWSEAFAQTIERPPALSFLLTDLSQTMSQAQTHQRAPGVEQKLLLGLGDGFEWGDWPQGLGEQEGLVVTDYHSEVALSASDLRTMLAEQARWMARHQSEWQAWANKGGVDFYALRTDRSWAVLLQALVPALLSRAGARG